MKTVNRKGVSVESEVSNTVFVEKVLPPGWFRFYDTPRQRYYYANLKLRTSRWTRPEEDAYFLDEYILDNFEEREIDNLKSCFHEEIEHFRFLTSERFVDMMQLEVGEKISKRAAISLFKGYAKSKPEQPHDPHKLSSWTYFMEICNHIKRSRMNSWGGIGGTFEAARTLAAQASVGFVLGPSSEKLGNWEILHSKLADREYYKNIKTGETMWSMPLEVKFYLPPKLERKLLRVFTYGELEEFEQQFLMLDIDSSGDLSSKEIRMLLKALDIECSETLFNKLVKTIDLNGNGTIEYDEFCYMMYEIYRKDKGGEFWQELKSRKHAGSRSKRNQMMDIRRNDDDSTIITASGPSYDSLIDGKGGDGWVSSLSRNLNTLSNDASSKDSFCFPNQSTGNQKDSSANTKSSSWSQRFKVDKIQNAITKLAPSAHARFQEEQRLAFYYDPEKEEEIKKSKKGFFSNCFCCFFDAKVLSKNASMETYDMAEIASMCWQS